MVSLIGIPYDANSSFLRGPALAPARIRNMEREGSANQFSETGKRISEGKAFKDYGDLSFQNSTDPKQAFRTIEKKMLKLLEKGNPVLSLGGDHSITYPILQAYYRSFPNLHVLQLDAHTDLYDNFYGNPYSHASPFARIMEAGLVSSLTQAGLRTITSHQREQIGRFGVQAIEMHNWSTDFIHRLQGPLYISLDLDVLDPAFAPGVSHHEPGGLSTRELLRIIHQIKVPVVGVDIVEYNPARDLHDVTAMVGYKLMKELIAKMNVS